MTRRHYAPRPYQPIITNHILTHNRCAIWAGMGFGKTVATLTAVEALALVGDVSLDKPVLVTAPLRVARDTWPDEVLKWEHTRDLNVVPILGDRSAREKALKERELIYSINYENLPWLIKHLGGDWPFKTIIPDEATKLKGLRVSIKRSKKGKEFIAGQGTQRAKELARVAHSRAERFIELTGTPAPNGLKDLWGQAWFLDGGQRLGRTFESFKQRWFRPTWDGYGIEPLPTAQEQIEDRLRDICISLNPKDWFDLADPIDTIIPVKLPVKARRQYDELEAMMFTELQEEFGRYTIDAVNAAGRTNKCLQFANGAVYGEGGDRDWVEVHREKLEALDSVVEEAAGMPVLVAYHFKSDLARLKKHFPKGVNLAEEKGLKQFKAGAALIGFAHPASLGHGIDGLQNVTNILVFFGMNWDLELHDQITERIGPVRQFQAGLDRPLYRYYIMAENTVDYLVKERLTGKREVQDILMDAMKHRRR